MLIVTVLSALFLMAIFLYLVQSGWLARMRSGFLISVILAVAGTACLSAALLGAWSWTTARDIVFKQVIGDLQHIGDLAEASLTEAVTLAFGELEGDAREIATRLASTHPEEVGDELQIIVDSNERLLQVDIVDSQRKLLAERSATGAKEELNAEAIASALQGKEFISDAYFSPAFHRYVLYLATPIRDDHNAIRGALTSRYDLQTSLEGVFKHVRFGDSGYAVLVGSDGHIIAHPDVARVGEDVSTYPPVERALAGATGWLTGANKAGMERLFFYRPFQSPATLNPKRLAILTEIDESEALAPLKTARLQFLLGIGVLAVLAAIAAYAVSSSIVRPIDLLNRFVKKVEAGDLSGRIDLGHKDEIGRLATAMNEMTRGLQERDKLREAAISTQQLLEVARQIQMGLLPRNFPAFADAPQIDIHGMVRPALEVGGDLYDFFRLDENRICFVIGDVSDKGIPAALFMAMVVTSFEISAMTGPDSIARVLHRVNRFLNENNDSQMFVTLFAGILDLRTGRIDYSDGGHEPPFVVRRGSGVVELLQKKGGIALGVFDNYDFEIGTIQLDPGDALVLYTDGVNEAMNGKRELFSTPAIERTLLSVSTDKAAAAICQTVLTSVDDFVKGAPQSDDITILTIRYCGANA